jgi:AP-4 complex subunit epsilon-1
MCRLLYVEMLGHDASFGYIKAVEMAASASLFHKRTGYLVCSACLSPEHEFRFMLVNQMQRDLQSANVLEICGGLLAATSLITSDMVPAMSGEVTKLLTHDSETVRKKAVITLHRFYGLAPDVVSFDDLYEKGVSSSSSSYLEILLSCVESRPLFYLRQILFFFLFLQFERFYVTVIHQ